MREQEINVRLIRSRLANRAISKAREVVQFRERLQEQLFNGCMFCYRPGSVDPNVDHIFMDCKVARSSGGLEGKAFAMGLQIQSCLRREGGMEDFRGCYECFLPQEVCTKWEEREVQGGWRRSHALSCQYQGVMVSTIAYVYTLLPDEAEGLFSQLGFLKRLGSWNEGRIQQQEVWRWMGRRIDWGGLHGGKRMG